MTTRRADSIIGRLTKRHIDRADDAATGFRNGVATDGKRWDVTEPIVTSHCRRLVLQTAYRASPNITTVIAISQK
jgi:hypothetical protein